jgi:hypothetical protein
MWRFIFIKQFNPEREYRKILRQSLLRYYLLEMKNNPKEYGKKIRELSSPL